jgi:hypothetical protein
MKGTGRRTAKGTPPRAARWRLAWALSAGAALLVVGACENAVSPTAPSAAASSAPAASPTAVAPSASVRGSVVDSSGRPLADVLVQWFTAGDAPSDIGAWQQTHTDAGGSYALHVSGDGLDALGGWFWIDVSKQGFREDSKNLKVPDLACTWDNKKCDLVANFKLTQQ